MLLIGEKPASKGVGFFFHICLIRYMKIGEIKRVMRADYEMGMLDPMQSSILEPRASLFVDIHKRL